MDGAFQQFDSLLRNLRKNLRRSGDGLASIGNTGGNVLVRYPDVEKKNDELLKTMFKVAEEGGWQEIRRSGSIVIWRKRLSSDVSFGGGDAGRAQKFFVVMAKARIKAPARKLFDLFLDNSRVPEYNEHCKELKDLEFIGKNTKISWAATGRFGGGLLKARDFVTRVHYRPLQSGYVVVNRPEVHEDAKPTNKFVRAEVLLAGNVMMQAKDDPEETDFMVVSHVNPGGIADTSLGSKVINLLCANSPVTFINSLEAAANRK
mmetsp:Transcript_12213/g.17715  ORF Transcript_12213/g.17715 Transcript_12213/m.17715 type:complete len:261 (-) Transcript_12213:328-1110(-)|eukprot:CAMPEP_0184740950 /NCGR_PEP_ID=MMETSP0315-20130426/4026_1 /TAXON_ID=101924 /ORGANISM="Rhodosorus marinus, Strain UTEX LB 2760" /LENGTH=260 /DNA_ID=CAMNT_0027211007 /DNA_START=186 /DNA_END=968 /DNA_ORIENTATION=-